MFFTTQYIASKLQIMKFFYKFYDKEDTLIQPFRYIFRYIIFYYQYFTQAQQSVYKIFMCISIAFKIHSFDQQA